MEMEMEASAKLTNGNGKRKKAKRKNKAKHSVPVTPLKAVPATEGTTDREDDEAPVVNSTTSNSCRTVADESDNHPPKSTAFPKRSEHPADTQDGTGSSSSRSIVVEDDGAGVEVVSSAVTTSSSIPPPGSTVGTEKAALAPVQITYQVYESERQMPAIMALIQKDLSEPYSIYTYRYFIYNWPKLCFLALHEDTCVGAIVCKLDIHRQETRRGYIAMLAVDKDYRKLKIGTTLVQKAIQVMLEDYADEVVLETEITNRPALRLYENLGFVRDKRLFHYYLNGVDALRLKLWFK